MVAVPAFTYADVWFTEVSFLENGTQHTGSLSVTKKLGPPQHKAAKLTTGTLSMAAGDVLNAYANLTAYQPPLSEGPVMCHNTSVLTPLFPSPPWPGLVSGQMTCAQAQVIIT